MVKYVYCLGKDLLPEELCSLMNRCKSPLDNVYDITKLYDETEIFTAIKKLNEFPGLSVEGNFLQIESREAYFQDNMNEWKHFREEVDMSLYVTNHIPEVTPLLKDYDELVTQLESELGVLKNKYGSYVAMNNILLGLNDFLLTYAINGKKYEVKGAYEFEY